jgi:hypothetical protein
MLFFYSIISYIADILNIIKHMSQSLDVCYDSLVQEMNKKRMVCPLLFLLNVEDLVDILCCGNNINRFSKTISLVYPNISSLKSNLLDSNTQIVGVYGRSKEYLHFSKVSID